MRVLSPAKFDACCSPNSEKWGYKLPSTKPGHKIGGIINSALHLPIAFKFDML